MDGELIYSLRGRTNPLTLSKYIYIGVRPFPFQYLLYGAETTLAWFISIASFRHFAPFQFSFTKLALFVRVGGPVVDGRVANLMCRRRGYVTDVKRGTFLCQRLCKTASE